MRQSAPAGANLSDFSKLLVPPVPRNGMTRACTVCLSLTESVRPVTRPDCRPIQPAPEARASSPSWAMVGSTRAWSHSPPSLEMWIPSAHRTATPSIFDSK